MKILLLALVLLCVSCGLMSKQPRRVRVRPPKPYQSHTIKHFNCIRDYIKLEVEPVVANSICIDVFRKRF